MPQTAPRLNKMTVRDLIETLMALPPETRDFPVVFCDEQGQYQQVRKVRLCEAQGTRDVSGSAGISTKDGAVGLFV